MITQAALTFEGPSKPSLSLAMSQSLEGAGLLHNPSMLKVIMIMELIAIVY